MEILWILFALGIAVLYFYLKSPSVIGAAGERRVNATLSRKLDEQDYKYDEKARRPSYLAEVADIASQCSPEIADSFAVMSRYHFHPAWRACARTIHLARRGWDPEADITVLNVALGLPESFTLGELVEAAGLENSGWRAAIRLIGDGDIHKHPLDLFENDLICRRAA